MNPRHIVITLAIIPLTLAGCAKKLRTNQLSAATKQAITTSEEKNTNTVKQRISEKLPFYSNLIHKPWPAISNKLVIRPGSDHDIVSAIRQRLTWLGDYHDKKDMSSNHYDKKLQRAVERFQWRQGLPVTGIINKRTITQLNITPKQRLHQLKVNMTRWAEFPDDVGKHYIHINIPSFKLNIIKNERKVLSMKVIVGKGYRPTPLIYSKVQTLQFNPHWNVPIRIMRRDIIPRVIKNPDYLTENNIELFDSYRADAQQVSSDGLNWKKLRYSNIPFRMRQQPGRENALGRVKFIFMNEHDIYLHDTPDKELFYKIRRAYSSGCIRLQKPFHLVEYFIKENPEIDVEKINKAITTHDTEYVRIQNPLPIYVSYITAWVDKQGVTHFREDIYKRDNKKHRK